MEGTCMICQCESNDLDHLKLYVMGSEGCWVCLKCRMILTTFLQGMMSTALRSKKEVYKRKYKNE